MEDEVIQGEPVKVGTVAWMYCFQCFMSHNHTMMSNGKWRCSNCHGERCHFSDEVNLVISEPE